MYLTHLSLTNFRSYENLELSLNKEAQIFIGDNGEGKTNIAEAVMYLALLSSHRTNTDAPLIQLGKENAQIRARVADGTRDNLIEIEINSNRANRAKLNQNPLKSTRALTGVVRATCFSPEDLDIVRGDPSERRRFLDQLLLQQNPRMSGVIADYEKALRQRNVLLKARAPESSLHPWNEHLINFGGEIMAARVALLNQLKPHLIASYEKISITKKPELNYKSNIIDVLEDKTSNQAAMRSKIKEVANQERERGISLVGPHRDDLLVSLGEHPVKGFASHGESWSIVLALRLASYQLLKSDGASPILILDDVFSELDESRRERLDELSDEADQTFITVAVANDLPKGIKGARHIVAGGKVIRK